MYEVLSDRVSMAEKAYQTVLNRILNGELIPGEIINRNEIAAELEISLAPVSEALIRLTSEGFIEMMPRKHTRVRLVRSGDVRGQFALRLALERQAVAMIHGETARRAKDRLLELAAAVDRLPPKHPTAWPAEMAFHQTLVDLAECPALTESFKRVIRRNYFFGLHSAQVHLPDTRPPGSLHRVLVEGLCSDDPQEADRLLMEHFANDAAALLHPASGPSPGQDNGNLRNDIEDDTPDV
jgi:GntR family transcriptional regulator, rspAB operon transcriptional repressor